MNITLRRRARVLSPDFWEEQFRLLNERSIVHAYVPDGTIGIRPCTFLGCTIMQDIFLPNTITSIGNCAFQNCYALEKITIPSSCTTIGNNAFQNARNLQGLVIPASVRTIGDFAFSSSGLVNLTINEGVVSLGQQAFANITTLKNLVIPDSVTTLGNAPFRADSGLVNITIGKGVTAVPNECFWTSHPTTLTMRRKNPPTITSNAFQTWPTHIYVPHSADHSILNAYKTASVWSTYADRIEEVLDPYGLNGEAQDICEEYGVLEEVHNYLEGNPTFVSYINAFPNVIHSLVDTGVKAYINNQGSAYILTEYKIPSNYDIETEVYFVATKSNGAIFGMSSWSQPYFALRLDGITMYAGMNTNLGTFSAGSLLDIKFSSTVCTINGVSKSIYSYNGTNSGTFGLFNYPAIGHYKMNYISSLMSDGNTHKFIPYIQNEVVGMLDLHDNTFYSPTSGTFLYEEITA